MAAGEAIDELLAANDDHESSKKRKYPEPGFAVERSGPAGGRGSYTIAFKLKAAAFTRVRCADGNSVGNHGAARVLGAAKKRIIEWVKAEAKLKCAVGITPKVSRAKSRNAGKEASTADVDQALKDYINEQRKEHRGCGSAEVMNKLLEIKPDALGAYPPMLRRRKQRSSGLGSTTVNSVFAGAGSLVSVGVPAWAKSYPQDKRVWRGRR